MGLSLFQQVMMEADDDGIDIDSGPPPMDDGGMDDSSMGDMDMGGDIGDPPDFGDDSGSMDMGGDAPMFSDDGGGDPFGDPGGGQEGGGEGGQDIPDFDDKVSDTLNARLYQDFLKQLNTLGSQITLMKNNSDMIYAISAESIVIQSEYEKLEENIREYLDNYFNNRIYSENLLFFNKTLNLLKLYNDKFKSMIDKGVKSNK